MSGPIPSGVPTPPNACLIRGRIARIEPAPGGAGCVWSVELTDAIDLPGSPNLAKSRVGSTVPILVHPGFRHSFDPGTAIEARVSFQGDERGGSFFLQGQHARSISSK